MRFTYYIFGGYLGRRSKAMISRDSKNCTERRVASKSIGYIEI